MFRPRSIALVLCACLTALAFAPLARGDAAGAKKYLDEATKDFADGNPDDAEKQLKLADVELDGVPATDPVAKSVAALRNQMAAAGDVKAKADLQKNIDYLLRMCKESLGRASDTKAYTGQLEDAVNSDDGKKFLTDAQRADYLKQVATMRKASAVMSIDTDSVRLDQALKRAEDRLPEVLQSVKERGTEANSEVNNFNTDIESLKKQIAELPADNAKVKPLAARFAKLSSTFDAAVNSGANAEMVAGLKRFWDSYESEWGGWEKETNAATWDEVTHKAGGDMGELHQPKTVALVSRADYFLKSIPQNEGTKNAPNVPEAKAVIDDVTKQRDAAMAKLVASIAKVLDAAEKDTLNKDKAQSLTFFHDTIRHMLDDSPQKDPLQARAKALVDKFESMTAGKAKATEELTAKLTAEAGKAWPAISAKFPAADAFDPGDAVKNIDKYKGKTVRLDKVRNWLGWDYNPGDYDFAITKNGIPIAARFDPAVRAAVKSVTAQTKDGLPDEWWDVVAVVEGIGKIDKREQNDLTSNGTTVARVETHDSVDAPVLRIVAVHAGPVATSGGSVAAASLGGGGGGGAVGGGGGGSSAGAWLWRFLTLVIGLAAAASALLKANFAPLAGVPQVGAVRTKLGDENLGYLGVAFAVLGIIWLLKGMVIYGLLTSLAIIAAGLYVALDLLEARGIVKPDLAAKVRPLGVMIGLACAALVVLSFITGGALVII